LDRTIEEKRKSILLEKQFPELAALLASGSNLATLVASGETTLIPLLGYIISLIEISIHQSPSFGYGFEMQ
jgi:wyosine [tRNA(Phe)-imidazoG37] synthetase (radical SAM superfamily)